jgi:hypothetical protein
MTIASGVSFNSDSIPDIIGRQNSTGKLFLYKGTSSGTLSSSTEIGHGFW